MMRAAGLALLFGFAWSAAALAQDRPPAHIVGDRVSQSMRIDGRTRMVVDTATLTFQDSAGGQVYTIDFVTRHPVQAPVAAPGVVDIVVTQMPVEDEAPEMTIRVDGDTMPVVARLHGRRSVVASVSLEELDRIANAGAVVDRTFGVELEFGAGQTKMLHATVERWLGRVR
jgi:hypothetical protein